MNLEEKRKKKRREEGKEEKKRKRHLGPGLKSGSQTERGEKGKELE